MMPTIGIMTIVFAALTIYLCHDEHKNGKMSSKNFKIVAICEGLAILGMIFLIISLSGSKQNKNWNLKEIYVMEAVFIFLGMVIGIVIGQQYYKHQIVKKKNKKVISQVKEWLEEAEE